MLNVGGLGLSIGQPALNCKQPNDYICFHSLHCPLRGHGRVGLCLWNWAGKRKRIFQEIYFSVEEADGIGVIYTKTGEYSAVLKLENPVQKYCANIDSYYEFTQLFTAIAQTLGEGYAIHKQDIFIRKKFTEESDENREFLSTSYFRYFNGRPYTDSECYLTITQEVKKSRLFSLTARSGETSL